MTAARPTRIHSLTGLRFFAALLLFLGHAENNLALHPDSGQTSPRSRR